MAPMSSVILPSDMVGLIQMAHWALDMYRRFEETISKSHYDEFNDQVGRLSDVSKYHQEDVYH